MPYSMTNVELQQAAFRLSCKPTEMARAMGVSYATYKDWQSGRRKMPAVAGRCVELLLLYPRTAHRMADTGGFP